MICKYCKKEFDDAFAFCPHCGKKAAALPMYSSFTNFEWYSATDHNKEYFRKTWETLKARGADALFDFMMSKHVVEYGYTLKASGIRTFKRITKKYANYNGTDTDYRPFTWSNISPDFLLIMANRSYERESDIPADGHYSYNLRSAEIVRKQITKADLREIGVSVFFTQEEAEAAYKEAFDAIEQRGLLK